MDSRLLATIIIFPIWLTLVLVFRRHRQWLFYYLIAAFGLTLQLVFLAEHFALDQLLVNLASFHVNLISKNIFHIPMELMSNGRFQLILTDGSSSILKLGIECSAILESSIVFSLLIFYPLFSLRQRILRVIFGLIVTYVINILRLMIIVLMADKFGPDYIFLAHAGVARVFFFVSELLLYWYLMTKPTVKSVGDSILAKQPLAQTARSGHSLLWRHTWAQAAVILIFIGLTSSSFVFSGEWRKAFTPVAQVNRPIIYQEETDLTKSTSPQNNQILGEQNQVIHSTALKNIQPNQEITYDLPVDNPGLINIVMAEAKAPFRVEVYLNGRFANATMVKGQAIIIDRRLFAKGFEVNPQDLIRLKIINLGSQSANYLINFEEN